MNPNHQYYFLLIYHKWLGFVKHQSIWLVKKTLIYINFSPRESSKCFVKQGVVFLFCLWIFCWYLTGFIYMIWDFDSYPFSWQIWFWIVDRLGMSHDPIMAVAELDMIIWSLDMLPTNGIHKPICIISSLIPILCQNLWYIFWVDIDERRVNKGSYLSNLMRG